MKPLASLYDPLQMLSVDKDGCSVGEQHYIKSVIEKINTGEISHLDGLEKIEDTIQQAEHHRALLEIRTPASIEARENRKQEFYERWQFLYGSEE